MLDHALRIAGKGKPVFPCQPNKRPYTPKGFKDATTDPEMIRAWWGTHPDALIGMPTGECSGLAVVDLDQKPGIDGYDSFTDLERKHSKIAETLWITTPSGGHHIYFRHPGNGKRIKTNAGKLGLGIDVRGDGGYVIIPPSPGYDAEGETSSIADMPEWLLALTEDRGSNGTPVQTQVTTINQTNKVSGNNFVVSEAVASILAGAPLHDSLRSLAAHFRATGVIEPAAVDYLKALMNASQARIDRPEEWGERYRDIGRLVRTAHEFAPEMDWQQIEDKGYSLIWADQVAPRLEQNTLIRGLILPESMIVTYGESNSGKTFHVLDRDLCLAAGQKWYDRETEQGFVLYVAAEGPHSVERRVFAYMKERAQTHVGAQFAILPQSINLLNPDADAWPLIDFIKKVQDEHGLDCIKVTADTLARVIAGGNENSSEDMGALVRNADLIRQQIGCAFEFIHHSGKDTAKGARGHSSLRAATDTEIEVTNDDGYHVAKVTKQRDLQCDEEFAFTLPVTELGTDKYSYPITTCIPHWNTEHTPFNQRTKTTDRERRLLKLMKEYMEQHKNFIPAGVAKQCGRPPKPGQFVCPLPDFRSFVRQSGGLTDGDNEGTEKKAISRVMNSLQDKEIIMVFEDYAWLGGHGGHGGTN